MAPQPDRGADRPAGGRRPKPRKVDDAPAAYVDGQIRGIIGIEIAISRIEGKWKVSQNRPATDRPGIVAGLREGGAADMAGLVEASANAK